MKKILYAKMVKDGEYKMTYLLWTHPNKDTVDVNAIYFPSNSGIAYNGEGEFWKLPYSMHKAQFPNTKDANKEFMKVLMEKAGKGYEIQVNTTEID